MKRSVRKFFCVNAILLLAFTCCFNFIGGGPALSEAKSTTLSLSTFDSEKGGAVPAWHAIQEDIEAATGGEVKVKVYYSQALGKAKEHYEMALKGVSDLAFLNAGYTPGRFPLSELPSYSIVPSGAIASLAMAKVVESGLCDKEYGKVRIVFLTAGSPNQILWKKGVRAAVRLEDFKGKKIRVATTGAANLLKALGASPIAMPIPEVYTSMERGVIDGVYSMINIYDAFGIGHVSNEITRMNGPIMTFTLLMNLRTLKNLSPAARAVFEQNVEKYGVIVGENFDYLDEMSIKKYNPTFYDPSPNVKKIMKDSLSKDLKAYIEKYSKSGFQTMKAAKIYYDAVKNATGEEPYIMP